MQITRMRSYSVTAEDRPGELARILRIFRERRVRLRAIWGFGIGEGRTWVVVVPEDSRLLREISHRAGFDVVEGICFYVQGDSRTESVTDLLSQIAQAGVNVQAVDAIDVDGSFGSYIWADSVDVDRLGAVLNA